MALHDLFVLVKPQSVPHMFVPSDAILTRDETGRVISMAKNHVKMQSMLSLINEVLKCVQAKS